MSDCHTLVPFAAADIAVEPLSRLLGVAQDHLYLWDLRSDRLSLSRPWPAVFGEALTGDLMLGRALQARIAVDHAPARALAIEALTTVGTPLECTYKIRRTDGLLEWIEETAISAPRPGDGAPRVLGTFRIVTEAKEREERLRRAADHDRLTGLFNRERLAALMEEMLVGCRREGQRCGFLVVNIDNLGILNEAHGFAVVDEVIQGVARCVERQIAPDAILGRLGGNQCGVILPDSNASQTAGAAETIRSAVRASIFLGGTGPLSVTVSLGGVIAPDCANDVASMLGHAEEALARAKIGGRDRYVEHYHSPEQASERRRSMVMGDMVLNALKGHRLRLALQPIVRADDGTVAFHEALLRMEGDGGDLLPASAFMTVVERLGLVRLLDRHAFELGIDVLHASPELNLAVNISGGTAADGTAFAQLLSALQANSEVADRLTIEITETVAMQDTHEIAWFIDGFRELGCRVALDDFGAGYTSFRHLKNLAVDLVKIDGQFVRDISKRADNHLFVKAISELARGLGVETVAECVESEADAATLRRHGVDYLQGYFFGQPVLVETPPSDARPTPLVTVA